MSSNQEVSYQWHGVHRSRTPFSNKVTDGRQKQQLHWASEKPSLTRRARPRGASAPRPELWGLSRGRFDCKGVIKNLVYDVGEHDNPQNVQELCLYLGWVIHE